MNEWLRRGSEDVADQVLRRLQLIAQIEFEADGGEGVDEIALGNGTSQRPGELSDPRPIGNGQTAERELTERARVRRVLSHRCSLDRVGQTAQCSERLTPSKSVFLPLRVGPQGRAEVAIDLGRNACSFRSPAKRQTSP